MVLGSPLTAVRVPLTALDGGRLWRDCGAPAGDVGPLTNGVTPGVHRLPSDPERIADLLPGPLITAGDRDLVALGDQLRSALSAPWNEASTANVLRLHAQST